MPMRKRNVSRRRRVNKKKTTYRRRKYNRNKLSTVSSKLTPVPDRFFTRMRYSETLSFTTGSSFIPSTYFFRGTSIYDPDLTGTGHQPMGYDQLATLYQRYRVSSVYYKFTLYSMANFVAYHMVVENKDDTDTYTDYRVYMERPHTQHAVVNGVGAGVNGYAVIKGRHIPSLAEGLTKEQYRTDPDYAALVGSSPNNNSYIALALWASAASQSVYVDVELIYSVMFYETIELGLS